MQPRQAEDLMYAHLQLGSDLAQYIYNMQQNSEGLHYRMPSNELGSYRDATD